MAAHGKPTERVVPTPLALDTAAAPDWAAAVIGKDIHLLAAACAADRVILTRDDALQRALRTFEAGIQFAESLRWIEPVKHGDVPLRNL
jgi:hypothetical protein